MAPFAPRPPKSERRSAQQSERRAPQAGGFVFMDSSLFSRTDAAVRDSQDESVLKDAISPPPSSSPASSSSASTAPVDMSLPNNTAAIAGASTFFGVVFLLIIAWSYYLWRKKKRNSCKPKHHGLWSPVSEDGYGPSLPRKLVLAPTIPTDEAVKWQPAKISPWQDHRLPRKPPAALSKELMVSSSPPFTDYKGNVVVAENGQIDEKLPVIPTIQPPLSDRSSAIEPQPKSRRPLTQYTAESLSQYSHSPAEESTRSSPSQNSSRFSSAYSNPMSPQRGDSLPGGAAASAEGKGASSLPLPRLVTVTQTFPVTLHDELKVKVGETLRLVQEFKDGWTLCQRVGPPDAEKGAVPSCCVAERSAVEIGPPRLASLKRNIQRQSSSSLESDIPFASHTLRNASSVVVESSFHQHPQVMRW